MPARDTVLNTAWQTSDTMKTLLTILRCLVSAIDACPVQLSVLALTSGLYIATKSVKHPTLGKATSL